MVSGDASTSGMNGTNSQPNALYLSALLDTLPEPYASSTRALIHANNALSEAHSRDALDSMLCFALGHPLRGATAEEEAAWRSGQTTWVQRTGSLSGREKEIKPATNGTAGVKRAREEDGAVEDAGSSSKRVKTDDAGSPRFTIHSVSFTSPVRKKLDFTIHASALRIGPSSPQPQDTVTTVPFSSLKRAFVLQTPDKAAGKESWTIVLLVADTLDKKDPATQMQIILTVDARTQGKDSLSSTSYSSGPDAKPTIQVHPKGTETLPILNTFFSFLPAHVMPSIPSHTPEAGSKARPGEGELFAISAYRAAKQAQLFFLSSNTNGGGGGGPPGILWAPAKPCEFFAVADLAPGGEGARTLNAGGTGRMFTLVLTRKGRIVELPDRSANEDGDDEEANNVEEELGEETDFGMIDVKDLGRVQEWIRKHKKAFGRAVRAVAETGGSPKKAAPGQAVEKEDESDASDEDFVDEDDSDGGSPSSSSDEGDGDGDGGGEGGGEDEEYEEEAADSDAGSGDEDGEEEDEDAPLDPARHPLMQPGAMPRMSRATIDAVVGMVEEDMMGSGPGAPAPRRTVVTDVDDAEDEADADEEDQLDD